MRSVHSEYEGLGVRRQSRICLFEILKETSNLISELTDSNKKLSNHANRIKRETRTEICRELSIIIENSLNNKRVL